MNSVPLAGAKSLGHAVRSVVVYASNLTPQQAGGPGENIHYATIAADRSVPIDVTPDIGGNGTLVAAWYTLARDVHAVNGFVNLRVDVAGAASVVLVCQAKAGTRAVLGIDIHLLFVEPQG